MPDRILRAGILSSDAVNSLSWSAEVFYRRLMSVVDDFGRFDGRPAVLRAALYPLKLTNVSEPDVAKWIRETEEAALVRCYTVESRQYVEIQKFDQRLRAKRSKWPPPCGHLLSSDSRCGQPSVSDSVSVLASDSEGAKARADLALKVSAAANAAEDLAQVNLKDLPAHLNTQRMVKQWGTWMNVRRGFKKPKNWVAMFNAQIDFLAPMTEPDAFESLSASIRNGWQGLFPPRNPLKTTGGQPPGRTIEDTVLDSALSKARSTLRKIENEDESRY